MNSNTKCLNCGHKISYFLNKCCKSRYYLLVRLLTHVKCIFPENSSNPMMAYMMMTNKTSSAICNKGTIARRIEFRTTCKPINDMNIFLNICILYVIYSLGTPETSLKGLRTLNALKALTSNVSLLHADNRALTALKKNIDLEL